MKKGFTLVEILAVIVVLSILIIVAVPVVGNVMEDMKESMFESQVSNIKEGVNSWVADNVLLMPTTNNEDITLTLSQLKLGGYIDNDIKNPMTNDLFPDDMLIVVSRKNNEYVFNVKTDTGSLIGAFSSDIPFIFMYGNATEEISLNDPYVEKGIYVKYNGQRITDYTTVIRKDGVVVPSVDTTFDATFVITYTISYNGKTIDVVRNVVVGDVEPPVITYPSSTTVLVADALTYDLMAGVSATDNSGETITVLSSGTLSATAGTYQITYTASDSTGNERTVIRTINVVDALQVTLSKDGTTVPLKSTSTVVTVTDPNLNPSTIKHLWTTSSTAPTDDLFVSSLANGGTSSSGTGKTGNYYLWIYYKNNSDAVFKFRSNVFVLDNTPPTLGTLAANATPSGCSYTITITGLPSDETELSGTYKYYHESNFNFGGGMSNSYDSYNKNNLVYIPNNSYGNLSNMAYTYEYLICTTTSTSCTVTASNLKASTTFGYHVCATDRAGNQICTASKNVSIGIATCPN